VQVGDRLEICLPIEEIRQSNDNERPLPTIEFTEANIIYQDDAIVVLNKPAGIPSQGTTDPTRDHAYEALRRYLEEKEGREVYLAIHHRLDSDTSGPLLFCRKKSFNKPVQELFSERTAVKTYLAIVCLQKPLNKTEWRVENQLARSKKHPMKMESVASGGDQAVTSFRVLKQKDKYALIQAQPHTGRMHQIRVHLAEEGLPIVGDYIYAGKELGDQAKRTMLHSWKLEFTHPEDQRPICAEAPVPDDFQAMLVKMGLN
jgi:RluA family pseudouridine synthase